MATSNGCFFCFNEGLVVPYIYSFFAQSAPGSFTAKIAAVAGSWIGCDYVPAVRVCPWLQGVCIVHLCPHRLTPDCYQPHHVCLATSKPTRSGQCSCGIIRHLEIVAVPGHWGRGSDGSVAKHPTGACPELDVALRRRTPSLPLVCFVVQYR